MSKTDRLLACGPGTRPGPASKVLGIPVGLTALTVLGFALAAGSASGEGFTEETAWRNAAGAFALETFDGFSFHASVSELPSVGVQLDPFSLGPPQADTGHLGGSVLQSQPHGLYNSVDDVTSLGPFVIRPLNPGEEIVALGAWNVGVDDTLAIRFLDAQGGLIEEVETPDVGNRIFFAGIVSTRGASVVTISPVVGNQYIGIDDLQVVTQPIAAPVPSLAPLGLGVLLVGSTWMGVQRMRSFPQRVRVGPPRDSPQNAR